MLSIVLDKVAKDQDRTVDQIVHFDNKKLVPKEVSIKDKVIENGKLILQLDEKEKNVVYRFVESLIFAKCLKDFAH